VWRESAAVSVRQIHTYFLAENKMFIFFGRKRLQETEKLLLIIDNQVAYLSSAFGMVTNLSFTTQSSLKM